MFFTSKRNRHDLKAAMRDRDTKTLNPLKSLLSSYSSTSKEILLKKPRTSILHFESDEFLAPLIHNQIAKREDSLTQYKEYRRLDLADIESYEISVLQKYLPQPQTTREDVERMTIEAIESLRASGHGANDPGSMSPRRIYEWFSKDPEKRAALGPTRCNQNMKGRIIAETIKNLSDRIDAAPQSSVDQFKPKEQDELTKDRYQ